MAKKSTKPFIVAVILLLVIGVIAFFIYWSATAEARAKKQEMKEILKEIEEFRTGTSERISGLYISKEYHRDEEMIAFLCSELQTMCDNKEYDLLHHFADFLINDENIYDNQLVDTVVNRFNSASTLEDALGIRGAFDPCGWSYWDTIQEKMILNRNQAPLSTYIEKHGTRSFTMTPGEGFYAGYEDESEHDTIGLDNSPLYESSSTTYLGDFKCYRWRGVRLNSTYQEESYSGSKCYFKDREISFDPVYSGECVWSGDYLFCFSSYDGRLTGCDYIGTLQ